MRGTEAQRARAQKRDKWFEKDTPKYPVLDRDRDKLSLDEGRDKENWSSLAALARTGRPQRSFSAAKERNSQTKLRQEDVATSTQFTKPTSTVKLTTSMDGTLRCVVNDTKSLFNHADSTIVILNINGATKAEVDRVTNGKFLKIVPCLLEKTPTVESVEDLVLPVRDRLLGRSESTSMIPVTRLALRVIPSDAKRIFAAYGKRSVKKIIAGTIVTIRATECVGQNEARARGLLGNKAKSLGHTIDTYNPLRRDHEVSIGGGIYMHGVKDRGARDTAGLRVIREEMKDLPGTTSLRSTVYQASHMEQALTSLGSQIVEVQRAFDIAASVKGVKDKFRQSVVSAREATEIACKLCRAPVPGAGDIVRHFMIEQDDQKYLTFSDFIKLYAFGFSHFKSMEVAPFASSTTVHSKHADLSVEQDADNFSNDDEEEDVGGLKIGVGRKK